LDDGDIRVIKPSILTYQFKLSLVTKKSPRETHKVNLLKDVLVEFLDLRRG
jgi:hypothetical protein